MKSLGRLIVVLAMGIVVNMANAEDEKSAEKSVATSSESLKTVLDAWRLRQSEAELLQANTSVREPLKAGSKNDEATWDSLTGDFDGVCPPKDVVLNYTCKIGRGKNDLFVKKLEGDDWDVQFNKPMKYLSWSVRDSKKLVYFGKTSSEQAWDYPIATVLTPVSTSNKRYQQRACMLFDVNIQPLGLVYWPLDYLRHAKYDAEQGVLGDENVVVEGHVCKTLTFKNSFNHVTFYVCPEMHFLPLKFTEEYDKNNAVPMTTISLRYAPTNDQEAFPRLAGWDTQDNFGTRHVTVDSLVIGQELPPDLTQISFPPNTMVTENHYDGKPVKQYLVKADGSRATEEETKEFRHRASRELTKILPPVHKFKK